MRDYFRFEWLPDALAIGISEELFWTLNPHRLKAYVKADEIRRERQDEEMWRMGLYVNRATLASTENVLAGKKASITYFEEPLLATAKKEAEEVALTEEQQMKQVEALFTSLSVLATNSKLAQHKTSD